ncbi:hypothetical protein [Pectobacterium polaris]|uniref:hypothetical protein n=1 Tax=Pectobacterium polaris TaxID=2042057 RepID=UPI00240676ED|nr:hypothetical protein [Pectobacterium polaris]MDG0801442.1 hypothetical protein [Pectobacterium polaris]
MKTITFKYNSIIIIESLRPEDNKTGKDLCDALKTSYPDHKGIQYIPVTSKNDFIELMNEIKKLMLENDEFRPIIDIETHGDETQTQFTDGSFMKWDELMNITREINKICNNELVIFLACCEGYKFINSMSVSQYSPCGYLYSPSEEIYDKDVKEATIELFNTLTLDGSLDKAADLMEKRNIHCFKSEIFFLNALTIALIDDHRGKNQLRTDTKRAEFIDDLSKAFLGYINNEYTNHVIKCFNESKDK